MHKCDISITVNTGFVQKELVANLLKECGMMQKLEHPNVLKLTGVCLDGGPAPYIIMPYMANGNLLSYLQDQQEALIVLSSADSQIVRIHCSLVNLRGKRIAFKL